jgi:hypothetical protein
MEHLKPQHTIQETKDPITPEQYGQLHAWDIFLEELTPQLEADRKRMHAITPYEMRAGEAIRDLDK